MWQRFTERARKVVFFAQEEAQKFGEGYVSTEHLLLGVCREEDSVAARVLGMCGIGLSRIRQEVEKQLPQGDARPSQDMTLTPRAKRVIDLAYDEARNLNNNYIGTEHLLLGLIREGDGLAGRVLAKLGVELEKARKDVMALQDQETRENSSSGARPSPQTPGDWKAAPYAYEARTVLYAAQAFAQEAGQTEIRFNHVVRACLATPHSLAFTFLQDIGGTEELDRLMAAIDRPNQANVGMLPYSSSLKTAVGLARFSVAEQGLPETTSLHLLLALLQNPDHAATRGLGSAQVSPDKIELAIELWKATNAQSPADNNNSQGNLPQDEPQ